MGPIEIHFQGKIGRLYTTGTIVDGPKHNDILKDESTGRFYICDNLNWNRLQLSETGETFLNNMLLGQPIVLASKVEEKEQLDKYNVFEKILNK